MADSARDLLQNTAKQKLARDELVFSMTVRLTRGVEIAGIARTAGFDSLYIDLEHGTLSLEATSQICMASQAIGVTPLVRVPSIAPDGISRVLDAGALGVIAPHLRSARDAEQVVRAAKFPPKGERSLPGALPQLRFGTFPAAETIDAVNDATMVIAMIECAEALAAVDDIAAVEGVDVVLIGTNDLCGDLGIPGQLTHDSIRDAYAHCLTACRKHGKHLGVGGLGSQPKFASDLIRLGARYVSMGNDLSFLMSGAGASLRTLRELNERAEG